MGAGGISIWQLLIILVIVLLLFGTKRLKNLGSDLGTAIKGFRSAMSDADKDRDNDAAPEQLSEAERTDAKATNASAESHKRQP
ncbi:preprotein translocase subunit TatA [Marichromatium purpuratum 984]|uniref:Sec-independent protein translocase protein TatA n=1 Tax=Marichromatium purpuratum 984 TaxID=765910 RepID=W0DVK1_MARPU|nr:twin-arginine translocase TatA/TatE family subunit [Marichromatium purpuratum]AHF02472.1 preprotein translocase subunit TatA [Marichromatium purpuratum 984]